MAVREGQGQRRKAAPDAEASGARASGARAKGRQARGRAQGKAPARAPDHRGAFPLIALTLAIALIAVGVASYFAASLLQGVARAAARRGAETPTALADTVCDDFLHQNYDDLMARVDPNPAPPAATGVFDASAGATRLRAIDQRDGPVSSCSVTRLDASQVEPQNGPDGATRLLLVMWRVGDPIASVLVTRLGPDGAWMIERDSAFLLAT